MDAKVPYWRLASFYFCYYFAFGVWLPFSALYFSNKGFDAQDIGILVGMTSVTRIIAPNLWGWLADKTQRRMLIVRMGILLSSLVFLLMFADHSMAGMLAVVIGFTFFLNSVMSQFNVMTMRYLGVNATRYGRIRAWGSFGFVVAVIVSGVILDNFGIEAVPVIVVCALFFAATIPWTLPAPPPETQAEKERSQSFWSTLKQKPVIAMLMAAFALEVSHAPYYTFFSIHMESLGFQRVAIGLLWGIAVMAEVWMLTQTHKILQRFSVKSLLLAGLLAASLRWVITASFSDVIVILIFTQCLHALTFAVFHSASVEYVRNTFSYRAQGTAQAVLSASSYGAGTALGSLIVGMYWEQIGVVSFYWGALVSTIGALLIWYYLPKSAEEGSHEST